MSQRPHASDSSRNPQHPLNPPVTSEEPETSIQARQQHELGRPPTVFGRDATPPAVPLAPSRSIGMESILNPSPSVTHESRSRQGSRGPLESPSSSASPSAQPRGTPSPGLPPSQTDPGLSHVDSSVSPRAQARRILTPRSAVARAASIGGRLNPVPGTMDATKSPFLQSPPPHTTATIPSRMSRQRPPVHASSIFPEHRMGNVRQPNPLSQDNSPSTPHSSYSPFQQASPAHGPPPHLPFAPTPSGPPVGELGRSLAPLEQAQYKAEGAYPPQGPPMTTESSQGLIPYTIDLDSGSLKAAEKRRKNSHASKRFRQRKKAGEAEQMEMLKKQSDEIKYLKESLELTTEEKRFYESERNFFRDLCSRVPGFHVPVRPPSPRFPPRRPPPPLSESESEDRESAERNVRPRTGPAAHRMSLPSTLQPPTFSHPQQFQTAPPWLHPITSGPPPVAGFENQLDPQTVPQSHQYAPHPGLPRTQESSQPHLPPSKD